MGPADQHTNFLPSPTDRRSHNRDTYNAAAASLDGRLLEPAAHPSAHQTLSYCAHASPSASLPASISLLIFQSERLITAIWFEELHATYARFPSGLISTSAGPSPTSIVRSTFIVVRSTTATFFDVRRVTT